MSPSWIEFRAVFMRPALVAGSIVAASLVGGDTVTAQTASAVDGPIPVTVRWEGTKPPDGIKGPAGSPFEKKAELFSGSIPRPRADMQSQDLEVTYGGNEYPISVRVYPKTAIVQLTVSMEQPKSCADVFLRRLELPSTTATAALRAALTLGYLIESRSGEDSCEAWPLRAAKARFDRYQNAMERSDSLAIPEGIKAALRSAARTDSERDRVAQTIASADEAERQKVAMILQRSVLAELRSGDVAGAHEASALLLEKSKEPEYTASVASQITTDALEKQTSDLAERASTMEAERPQP